MKFENPQISNDHRGGNYFVGAFLSLEKDGGNNREVLSSLEKLFKEKGFEFSGTNEVSTMFQNPQLKCRSESLESVVGIIQGGKDVVIENPEDDANMCVMAGGRGFQRAMLEGFSERSVKGRVKVVVTFDSIDPNTHREKLSLKPIPRYSEKFQTLWDSRPETAQVSLRGSGSIDLDDIKMISLRLPIQYFSSLLREDEQDEMEEGKISHIVRHYVRKKNGNGKEKSHIEH